ncbi:MAG: alpha/beta hydrolase [Deltaproteobacteria bacterium]|nr:alpha/beta hydrolase [Deltaproteobacteria bacterium]
MTSAPELKYITANDVRLAYFEEGTGPLVLLIHGFPDTPHTWSAVRPAIAALGFRVVTPFTRGYFPSEIPRNGAYDADTLGQDVVSLITALGEERAVIVGHDWGASAAYSAAGLSPERVQMLITVAIPHPASVVPTPSLLWTVRHFFAFQPKSANARVRADDFAHLDELVQRWSPAWHVPPDETRAVKEALRPEGHAEAALGYYRALSLALPKAQRRPVTVPSVAFAGTDDLIAPSAYERARKRYRAAYEVVTMPGGHFMHREHPEVFIRELSRVLSPLRA